MHLMGICGTAMASLAGLLKDRGFKVSGSDSNPYPPMSTQIESLGIQIAKPYQASNLEPKPDFVVVGNVISANNPEAQAMVQKDIPFTSLPKALGEFIIENRQSIVVSGTHGKTTTTSMMAWIADCAKVGPGFLIGGIPKNFSQSFRNPQGDFFVVEGDEYDTAYFDKVPKFIHYRPKHVILTSVEFDHADIYKDLDAIKDAFRRLVDLVPEDGIFAFCADDVTVAELVVKSKAKRTFGYGFKNGDYRIVSQKITNELTEFSLQFKGADLGLFKAAISGDYNILNATASIVIAHQLGWDLDTVRKALQSFTGVKRRQEILGEPNGILVIEDFAHHPTAVRETVRGIKAKYAGRKIHTVFEPRSATSRRKIFQQDYVQAFLDADEIYLMKAFDQAKISAEDRFSSEELVENLQEKGKQALAYDNVESIVSDLKSRAKKGDLILVMSNGGFDGIYTKLLKAL